MEMSYWFKKLTLFKFNKQKVRRKAPQVEDSEDEETLRPLDLLEEQLTPIYCHEEQLDPLDFHEHQFTHVYCYEKQLDLPDFYEDHPPHISHFEKEKHQAIYMLGPIQLI